MALSDKDKSKAELYKELSKTQRVINELEREEVKLRAQGQELSREQLDILDAYIERNNEINDEIEKQNRTLARQVETRQKLVNVADVLVESVKQGWKFLMLSDKVIKSTILNLGMSGNKAEIMRLSFEQSAQAVAMLGGNIEDIGVIQQGFADETGRARAMTSSMVIDIAEMGKGTGLGIENATKLASQFEFMGIDVRGTLTWVQGVVDTTERMGINTTKVLTAVNKNFKKLSTFTFKKGVQGFGDMAISAEKTRVSMDMALNLADATRSLDKVIELGANLQVMGGNFAKMDPFRWLYMVRNEPEKLNNEISKMTTGLYTLKKNSDGTFQKFISPADADRMRNVGKALNYTNEQMAEIGLRRLAIVEANKDMLGKGFSAEQKEAIEMAAQLNTTSGKFQVNLAGTMKNITDLTANQAQSFIQEQVTLKKRALEAQTFDEAFRNTINALKSSLLPLLKDVNKLLEYIRPTLEALGSMGLGKSAALLLGGALALKTGAKLMTAGFSNYVKTGSAFRGTGGRQMTGLRRGLGTATGVGGSARAGGGAARAGAGKGMMRGGAGIGAAAIGIGAGIGIAAVGISKLADSMAKLDKTGLETLPEVIWALAGAMTPFAVALIAVAIAGTTAAPALLAVGVAALGIGAGIGIAAYGIGQMADGLGNLVGSSKGAGDDLLKVAGGIAGIAASMILFTAGGLGLLVFKSTMNTITSAAPAMALVGTAFEKVSASVTRLAGTKEDLIAVKQALESISKINQIKGGIFSEIANLMSKPLKVEWADKHVALVNDITLTIDGEKFMRKVITGDAIVQKQQSIKLGLGQ